MQCGPSGARWRTRRRGGYVRDLVEGAASTPQDRGEAHVTPGCCEASTSMNLRDLVERALHTRTGVRQKTVVNTRPISPLMCSAESLGGSDVGAGDAAWREERVAERRSFAGAHLEGEERGAVRLS